MIGRTNAGSGKFSPLIIVDAPAGSSVSCTNGIQTKTAAGEASQNLFCYTELQNQTKDGVSFETGDEGIAVSGKPTAAWISNKTKISLAPGTYTLGGKIAPTGKVRIEIIKTLSSDQQENVFVDGYGESKPVTIDGTEKSVEINIVTIGQPTEEFAVFVQPMLSPGSTAKNFEPYYEGERFIFKNVSYGTWAVVQEKDGEERLEVLHVNEIGAYKLSLGFKLVLLSGAEGQGNWSLIKAGSASISFNGSGIVATNNGYASAAATKLKLKVTDYSTLKVDFNVSSASNNSLLIGINSSRNDFTGITPEYVYDNYGSYGFNAVSRAEPGAGDSSISLNLSNVTGEYYIWLYCRYGSTITFKDVRLLP